MDNPYIVFGLISLIFSIAAYYPFVYYGKAFLWGTDGINQHIQTLRFTRDWIRSLSKGEFSFWSLQLGFGEGVFGNVLHFRIINFLCCLFPAERMELFLVIRTLLYQLFAGFAFIFFVCTITDDTEGKVLGALAYSFSAYTLYFGPRHAFFIEMMIFLPLLCKGIHSLIYQGKSLLLIIIVAIVAVSYIYFLLMVTLPALAYAVGLYFDVYDESHRSLLHFLGILINGTIHYIVGLLLASFSLFPQLIALFSSARIGTADLGNMFIWDTKFYMNLFQGFLGVKEFGIYGYIAITAPCFISIVFVFANKTKEYRLLRRQLLCCLLVLCFPILTMAFSGFAGKTERWCFVIAFWNACSLAAVFPLIRNGKAKSITPYTLIVLSILVFINIIQLVVGGNKPSISMVMLISSAAIIVSLSYIGPHKQTILSFGVMLSLMFAGLSIQSFELYSSSWNNYIDSFVKAGTVNAVGRDNAAIPITEYDDSQDYRTDLASFSRREKYKQLNYGISDGLNGVSSYYSYTGGDITDFSLLMGNSQQENAFLVTGWSQRSVLNEISSVKYLASYNKDELKVPKGYELYDTKAVKQLDGSEITAYIYRNTLPLPLMYAESKALDIGMYNSLSIYDKEHALLKGVLIENDDTLLPTLEYEPSSKLLLSNDEVTEQFSNADNSILQVFPDHIHVSSKNVKVEFKLDKHIEGEHYFVFKDMRFVPDQTVRAEIEGNSIKRFFNTLREKEDVVSAASVTAICNKKWDSVILLSPSQQYYFGKRDVILNLGYEDNCDSVQLVFSSAGDYYFSDSSFVTQPMDDYEESIAEIRSVPVSEITVGSSTVSGSVSCNEKMAVCISVPYSKGWTAYINGNRTKVYRANGMYMAVIVPPGENQVVFEYSLPGFSSGFVITCITFFVLICFILIINKRKDFKRKS